MISYWPTPAFSNEIIHIYYAKNLIKIKKQPDKDEFLKTKFFSLEKIFKMIQTGEIMDSKSIIGILFYLFKYKFTQLKTLPTNLR